MPANPPVAPSRRRFLGSSAGALLLAAAPGAFGQAWPARPLTIVVPFAAGGGADAIARMVAIPLGEVLGQSVVVENRPGANGNLGAAHVAKARADGHTLLLMVPPIAYANALQDNLPFRTSDIAPVINMVSYPFAISAWPGLQASNLAELVELAKKNPGGVKYASTGTQTGLVMRVFQERTGIRLLEVRYKGAGDARPAVMNGTVDISIETPSQLAPLVEAGRLKMLGVGSGQRLPAFPNVQTVAEVAPGMEMLSWLGLGTTAGTPREIVERLNREVATILRRPEVSQKMAAMSYDLVLGSPDAFAATLRAESELYGRVIRQYNLKDG